MLIPKNMGLTGIIAISAGYDHFIGLESDAQFGKIINIC
jgi:hypothetical protein